jgi:hypothetical protein
MLDPRLVATETGSRCQTRVASAKTPLSGDGVADSSAPDAAFG